MSLILILIIFLFFLFLFWYFGRKPKVHKNIVIEDIKLYIEILIKRGFNNGFMILEVQSDKKTRRFIQFSKYIKDKDVGIKFSYPLANWSQEYYRKLKIILKDSKIDYKLQKTNEIGIKEFLVVKLSKNINMAVEIATLVLINIYGLDSTEKIQIYFDGVSEDDIEIGF